MTTQERPKALAGVRVLDMTILTAGAGATAMLADLGAEIIKVESVTRLDNFRNGGTGERGWNRSPNFNTQNRNKYGITLDLKTDRGRELFLRLAAISDVVSENFRIGVMAGFGLGYEALKAVNPDVIMISVSSQGIYGPEARYGSYGSTLDALSGLAAVTGYVDGPPLWSGPGVNYPDQLVCTLAAGAVMAALHRRNRTGEGCYIDFSQREAITSALGHMLLAYSVDGREPQRMGNGHPFFAPHGCYPCAGEDQWLTLAVRSEAEWQALCEVMGKPELLTDARFAEHPSRYQNRQELDAIISDWTRQLEPRAAFELLAKAGLAAGPVLGGPTVLDDPQMLAREFFQEVTHPEAGPLRMKTLPMKFSRTPGSIQMPAPTLGQHNSEILGGLLGLSEAELDDLEREGVIGTVPTESEWSGQR